MPPKKDGKKAPQAAKNGAPSDTKAAAPKAAAQADARVTQSLRVLEIVGAERRGEEFSPRTEGHVSQLADLLEGFGHSRGDIAGLVRRCNHDEQLIQNAVANIIEDKANNEPSEWAEKKTKKQMKEEKKEKEELDRIEHERMEQEMAKARAEEEKRLAREAKKAAKAAKEGGAALPPDPAILFAGSKPGNDGEAGKDSWYKGAAPGGDQWAAGGDDWEWKGEQQWTEDAQWNKPAAKEETWWEGEWETAGSKSSKSKKAKAKEKGDHEPEGKGKGKSKGKGPPPPEKAQPAAGSDEMWDMPDVNANANEGSLDQWALGDIREYEQRAGGRGGLPPGAAVHTAEEVERAQLGAPLGDGGQGGKSRIEMLLGQAHEGAAPPAHERERPERGRGRGDGGKDGKGKGRGRKGADRGGGGGDRPERAAAGGGGDKEEKGDRPERVERIDRSDDPRRQAVEDHGENVTVRKHSSMGCAVVSMKDPRVREAIISASNEVLISGIKVQMKRHTDKETGKEVMTDLFVAWGRQVEKTTPLSEHELTKFFDDRHKEITEGWRVEEEAKLRLTADKIRQQQLLEQQQRQVLEQQSREEQRRRFEEEQRLAQLRQLEERQAQVKRVQELSGTWTGAMAAQPAAVPGAGAAGVAATAAAALAQAQAPQVAAGGYPQAQAAAATAAAQQWSAAQAQQWMQAMAMQQGWQQQMAARSAMQQMAGGVAHGGLQQGAQPDYEHSLRAQAAYAAHWQYLQEQQRGQQQQGAAYGQPQQGGFMAGQQNPAAFGYGGAAQQQQQQQPYGGGVGGCGKRV